MGVVSRGWEQAVSAKITSRLMVVFAVSLLLDSIDTLTDLQSCGGCWTDGSGVDCTLLDHPDMSDGMQIACVDGRCQGG